MDERRGLRFTFHADAEMAPENSPANKTPSRVTEISLRGCFVETSAAFEEHRPVIVKIFHASEFFEAEAAVLYIKPSGLGLVFREVKPHFRAILQKWILFALNNQPGA